MENEPGTAADSGAIAAKIPESNLRKNLRTFFFLAVIFPGFLFVTRPATTTGSLVFRIALVVIGLVGLAYLTISGRTARQPGG